MNLFKHEVMNAIPRQSKKIRPRSFGFTLIEILVVVSILSIMTALLVPRLRMVTKERNIREAARIVGSMFSRASQMASLDGIAGVVLIRNPNVFDAATNFQYAVTQVGVLRRVPDYTGDQLTSTVTQAATPMPGVLKIDMPLEQDALQIVQAGDSIRISGNPISYQIVDVRQLIANELTLVLDGAVLDNSGNSVGWGSYLPDPNIIVGAGAGRKFKIERLPRLLRSSLTDLPDGHQIDLRFSGCQTTDSGYLPSPPAPPGQARGVPFPINVVEPNPQQVGDGNGDGVVDPLPISFFNSELAMIFDDQGKFDRLVMKRTDPVTLYRSTYSRIAQGPFLAFVTAAELDLTVNPLADDKNLWVSVGNTSGVVNVGYNSAQNVSLGDLGNLYSSNNINDRVLFNAYLSNARGIAVAGSSAQ